MIHPVRPVGWSMLSAPAALYALCSRLGLPYSRCRMLRLALWAPLPVVLAARSQLASLAAAPLSRDIAAVRPGEPSAVEPWQPWPAHAPFADEVTRWWPSDDWPPAEPAIVVEDHIPDLPPELVDWRSLGSLLDFWA